MTPTPKLTFTDAAAAKVLSLIIEEGDPNLNLRVYITGGGCSGFQYGFTFDHEIKEDDWILSKLIETSGTTQAPENSNPLKKKVNLLIDALSYQYLVGSEIDYVNDLNGERFVIRNPNAKSTCGCGSSFSPD